MPRKAATIPVTKAELTRFLQEAPASDKKKDKDAYIKTFWEAKKELIDASKPPPTIYQLFCFEQRPIIMKKLRDEGKVL